MQPAAHGTHNAAQLSASASWSGAHMRPRTARWARVHGSRAVRGRRVCAGVHSSDLVQRVCRGVVPRIVQALLRARGGAVGGTVGRLCTPLRMPVHFTRTHSRTRGGGPRTRSEHHLGAAERQRALCGHLRRHLRDASVQRGLPGTGVRAAQARVSDPSPACIPFLGCTHPPPSPPRARARPRKAKDEAWRTSLSKASSTSPYSCACPPSKCLPVKQSSRARCSPTAKGSRCTVPMSATMPAARVAVATTHG